MWERNKMMPALFPWDTPVQAKRRHAVLGRKLGGWDRCPVWPVLGWSQDAACFSDSLYPHLLTRGQSWEAGDTTQMCGSHETVVRLDHSGRIENNGGSPVSLPRAGQSPASGSYLGRTPLYCPKPSHHWPKDWSSGIRAAWQPSKAHSRP